MFMAPPSQRGKKVWEGLWPEPGPGAIVWDDSGSPRTGETRTSSRLARLLNARNRYGSAPLHKAAAGPRKNLSVVLLLLSHNADTNVKDIKGRTPIHRCRDP
ncbi:unnamed protein product, partial [Discosporangium mesarthrocarpum]